ncbi:hypothetical protein B0H14DRAFT_3154796 [Mycena olivaceomarginata]|nr:hypothetical protein B0H14DRAFT_3154796 [Mycena olivaceomarginata]
MSSSDLWIPNTALSLEPTAGPTRAIVAGGNAGLGYTTLSWPRTAPSIASRIPSTAAAAIISLKAAVQVEFLAFDLRASKAAEEEFSERRMDILVLNAGCGWWWQMAKPYELVADGIELQGFNGTELNQKCTTAMDRYWNTCEPGFNLRARGGDCCLSSGWRGTPVWMRPSVAGRAAVFFGRADASWNPEHPLARTSSSAASRERASATTSPCTPGSSRPTSTAVYTRLACYGQPIDIVTRPQVHASYPWLGPRIRVLEPRTGRAHAAERRDGARGRRDLRAAYLTQRTPSSSRMRMASL